MANINGYKKDTKVKRDISELIGHYVIICDIGGKVNYLADKELTSRTWTNRMHNAKRFYDLSAADLKVLNLKYDKYPMYGSVKYVTQNLRLAEPRRNYDGR